jgi:hypothetical protein
LPLNMLPVITSIHPALLLRCRSIAARLRRGTGTRPSRC